MKVQKCIEANNETSTIEELSNVVSDFGYDSSRMLDKMKENPAFQKIQIKITFELTTN